MGGGKVLNVYTCELVLNFKCCYGILYDYNQYMTNLGELFE